MKKIKSILGLSIIFLSANLNFAVANGGPVSAVTVEQNSGNSGPVSGPISMPTLSIPIGAVNPSFPDSIHVVLDKNDQVSNIIICGIFCKDNTFNENNTVLIARPDVITGELPKISSDLCCELITTYDRNTNTFISTGKPTTNSIIENDGDSVVESSVNIYNGKTKTFSFVNNIFTENLSSYSTNTKAKISVNKDNNSKSFNISESLIFENRKTTAEIRSLITDNNLNLLFSKVDLLISLLGSWVK